VSDIGLFLLSFSRNIGLGKNQPQARCLNPFPEKFTAMHIKVGFLVLLAEKKLKEKKKEV
jgi:hypothetical protein